MTVFDNGSLKDNPILAQAMVTQLLAGMGSQISETSTDLSKTPLLEIHDEIWSRISQVSRLLTDISLQILKVD